MSVCLAYCLNSVFNSRCFKPGEGPSGGLLCDCEPSDGPPFQALAVTLQNLVINIVLQESSDLIGQVVECGKLEQVQGHSIMINDGTMIPMATLFLVFLTSTPVSVWMMVLKPQSL